MPNVQVGNEVIQFPDNMTPEQINRVIQDMRIAELPMGLPMQATVEPAAAMAGSAAGQVLGGLYGLGRTGVGMLAGEDAETALKKGAEGVESVSGAISDFTAPRTQFGARGMRYTSESAKPLVEGINDLSQYLGDKAYEFGGKSPVSGAAGYLTPTAILELLGVGALRRVMPNVRFLDEMGNPTPELLESLREIGLSWTDLDEAAKARVPQRAGQTPISGQQVAPEKSLDPVRAAQIQASGSEGALAPLMLESAAGTSTVTDPLAQRAILQWDDKGLVQAVKTATPETREAMLQMIDLRQRISDNKRLSQTQRPTDIVGASATQRVDYLRRVANQARTQLNEIADAQLAGKPMDTQPIVARLNEALSELDVGIVPGENGLPKPIFEGSMISKNPSAKRVIKDLFDLLSEGGAPDALRFHKLKRQLDEMIDYRKQQQAGLTATGQNMLKNIRSALNQELRKVNPEYGQVNDVLSDVLTVFDDLDSVTGRRTNIFDPDAAQKMGQEFRKLFSNYGVRSDMIQALESMDSIASKYGGSFNDSVMDLAMFANALDTRFGPVAETSFSGDIAKVMKKSQADEMAMEAANKGFTRSAIDKLMETYQSARGVSDEAAYSVMQELLKRNQ